MQSKNITIVGAGLVGSLLSIYLAKKGHKVSIFERRPDMRKETISAGKSINLALSDRGWKALDKIGVGDEIRKISIPMYGRKIHNADGSSAYQPYGKENQAIYSVSRGEINKTLMSLAEQISGNEISFESKCTHIDWNKNEAFFEKNNQTISNTSDLIFGSDGAFSAGRLHHQLTADRFNYQQHYIDCGYKELTIPAGENGSFKLEKNALHIWPRKDFMMIALPNFDGSYTCTLFFPFEGEMSFSKLDTKEKVKDFFDKIFPDAVALMPTLVDDFFYNPTSSLVTVKCFPWVRDDKFALIGDAAHAIVPFFGQGMNCGFEDCYVLNELIEKNGDDWKTILNEYQISRKPDSDAIADLAIQNFVEMRDRVADPKFLLQKKIEAKFNNAHPEKWIPAYSMVTFSPDIRYSEALKNGQRQEKIMEEVMKVPDIEKIWDSKQIEDLILSKI
ncbi:MAG: NAD(P)/FAD-dependent oxidoreductase [Bacteroidota bacterium]